MPLLPPVTKMFFSEAIAAVVLSALCCFSCSQKRVVCVGVEHSALPLSCPALYTPAGLHRKHGAKVILNIRTSYSTVCDEIRPHWKRDDMANKEETQRLNSTRASSSVSPDRVRLLKISRTLIGFLPLSFLAECLGVPLINYSRSQSRPALDCVSKDSQIQGQPSSLLVSSIPDTNHH